MVRKTTLIAAAVAVSTALVMVAAAAALPPRADSEADPDWEEVSPRETYDWHDHRIHWMSKTLPPKVRAAMGESHHIFDWSVPLRLEGRALAIGSSLDYEPPPGGAPTLLIGVLVVLVLGVAVAVGLRLRRQRTGRSAS